jgi:hypothetical protein
MTLIKAFTVLRANGAISLDESRFELETAGRSAEYEVPIFSI